MSKSIFLLPAILTLGLLGGTLCAPHPALAQSISAKPRFTMPVDCQLGETCWIVNYVDVNPSPDKVEDFTCGPRSFEGHKGTDFAVRSRAEMREGVAVLAAMDGTVERIRNGEEDNVKTPQEIAALKENTRECGNGVLIDHGAALKTIYCHLKKDSITVATGDKVASGDKIGEIGQSGMAEFPHLHFGVLWEDGIVDPFTGQPDTKGCGQPHDLAQNSLWHKNTGLKYQHAALFDAGFQDSVPDFRALEDGQPIPSQLPSSAKALVFWTGLYGVREGDVITLHITDPHGQTVKDLTITQEATQARQYYYTGRALGADASLPVGVYTGTVTLERTGHTPLTLSRTIAVH